MQQTGDYIYDRMVFWAMIFLAAMTVLMERVHKMIEEDLRIARHLAEKRKMTEAEDDPLKNTLDLL